MLDNDKVNSCSAIVISITLFFILFLFPAHTYAAGSDKRPTVNFVSFSFPPILHATENEEFSGTMGETVKMLCEAGKLSCNFNVIPLKRAYVQLKEGIADALITINIGQLNDCCIPSDWASPWTAGFFSSQGIRGIPTSQKELVGKSLIVVTGMKSPYFFAKDLDKMDTEQQLTLYKAPNILSSVKMFLKKRSPLLWGGEEFEWYIRKLDKSAKFVFIPYFEKPVVVWVRKDKPEILNVLNQAFVELQNQKILNDKNLLVAPIMRQKYVDAPFVN
jgi:hypothetical protein